MGERDDVGLFDDDSVSDSDRSEAAASAASSSETYSLPLGSRNQYV
jgi:hypothetical protein